MSILSRIRRIGKIDRHLIWLLCLTFTLFIVTVFIGITSTARQINALDAERTRASIQVAINREIKDITRYAEDNGIWDDAAIAFYGPTVDLGFTESNLNSVTEQKTYYDRAFVVSGSGKPILAYRSGQKVGFSADGRLSKAAITLSQQMEPFTTKAAAGIFKTPEGLILVAVSNILPSSPELKNLIPKVGPHKLIVARPFSQSTVSDISRAIQVPEMRLLAHPKDVLTAPIFGADGKPVGQISWPTPTSSWDTIKGSLKWLVGPAILHLLLITALSWRGFKMMGLLGKQATIDSLSNLPNRRALQDTMASKLKANAPIALAFIDLDGFKAVNDNYGHDVGDTVIRYCAAHLTSFENNVTMVARLGGDEFAVVAFGSDCVDQIQTIADSILNHLSQPFHIGERTIGIGASIGMASNVSEIIEAGELMRRADLAMYAAKNAGKMRVFHFDASMDERQAAAHTLERDMRHALDNNEFSIAYQPLVAASGEPIVGVEALLRWERGDGHAPIGPAEFIPIAEATGLIDRLGIFVLRKACSDALAWPDLKLSVNVSVAQLRNPEFPMLVRQALDDVGFPPERLELEVTETFLVHDPALAVRILSDIRAMGVQVALDDFGTGFASIGFLRQFEFQKLKIDRSLVVDAMNSDASRAMLNASISVAHALGMSIVAEGVETQMQADLMRVAGCQQLQGWHFSKAVSADEISRCVIAEKVSMHAA
jgi:diguanylate cyclase (GGDEF)-like protein